MSLKQKRLDQKKASEISGDTRAWNSFYMRQDTVWFSAIFDIDLQFLSVSSISSILLWYGISEIMYIDTDPHYVVNYV